MFRIALPLMTALALTACTMADGPGIEPIPGSITYGGHQPRTKLTKSPIGSTFDHRFYDDRGRQVAEADGLAHDRRRTQARGRDDDQGHADLGPVEALAVVE